MNTKSVVVRVHPDLIDEIERIKRYIFEATGQEINTLEASRMIRQQPIKIVVNNPKKRKRGFFDL